MSHPGWIPLHPDVMSTRPISRRAFSLFAAASAAYAALPGSTARAGDPVFGGSGPAVPPPMILPSWRNPGFFQVASTPGHYYARAPIGRFWGQLPLVLFLARLSVEWSLKHPTRPFGLGDMAREDGGTIKDHKSHSTGVGVDIYVINKLGIQRRWDVKRGNVGVTTIGSKGYDDKLTFELAQLITKLKAEFPFTQALFNDENVKKAMPHFHTDKQDGRSDQHSDHIHVLLHGEHPYTPERVQELLRLRYDL